MSFGASHSSQRGRKGGPPDEPRDGEILLKLHPGGEAADPDEPHTQSVGEAPSAADIFFFIFSKIFCITFVETFLFDFPWDCSSSKNFIPGRSKSF
jgi:hypothetical protein